jgi:hypothetical protein
MKLLPLLLMVACTSTGPTSIAVKPTDTLWVCDVYSECAVDPAVISTHPLCAAPSAEDVALPGDAAAADLAQLLSAECNELQGTAPSDDGREHACRLGLQQEPWSCDVECVPQFQACQP